MISELEKYKPRDREGAFIRWLKQAQQELPDDAARVIDELLRHKSRWSLGQMEAINRPDEECILGVEPKKLHKRLMVAIEKGIGLPCLELSRPILGHDFGEKNDQKKKKMALKSLAQLEEDMLENEWGDPTPIKKREKPSPSILGYCIPADEYRASPEPPTRDAWWDCGGEEADPSNVEYWATLGFPGFIIRPHICSLTGDTVYWQMYGACIFLVWEGLTNNSAIRSCISSTSAYADVRSSISNMHNLQVT
jgi:hypothetical protein